MSPRLPCSKKEAESSHPSVADDDNGDYLLQWSIQDDGKGLRVNVALSFAGTDAVAWSHTYRCRPTEFDDLPTYVADQIVQCLWLKVFFPLHRLSRWWDGENGQVRVKRT